VALTTIAVLFAACGGKTRKDATDQAGAAGSGALAGAGAAFAGAGGASADGSMNGGTPDEVAAGSGGDRANPGSGGGPLLGFAGAPADPCATPELAACASHETWFYYSNKTAECVRAGPGQCGSPGFALLSECLDACPGARPALDACDHGYDCRLVEPGCCAPCEPVAPSDLVAVNWDRELDANDCNGTPSCDPCPAVPELETTRQDYIPACRAGTCTLVDLRATDATACTTDGDCMVRAGSGCCELCVAGAFVALSSTDYIAEMCGPYLAAPSQCEVCLRSPTDGYSAKCDAASGHCQVVAPAQN
jgi:hypothetical protein